MLDPGHLTTCQTYQNYLSTFLLSSILLFFGFALLLVSLIIVCPGSRFRSRGGGIRIAQPSKSDFLTTLEINQISDSKFDAPEVDFGALWTSQITTFRTLESTFCKNADLNDILIFSMRNPLFGPPRSTLDHQKDDLKLVRFFITFQHRFWTDSGSFWHPKITSKSSKLDYTDLVRSILDPSGTPNRAQSSFFMILDIIISIFGTPKSHFLNNLRHFFKEFMCSNSLRSSNEDY